MISTVLHYMHSVRYICIYTFAALLLHGMAVRAQDHASILKTVVIDAGHGGQDAGAVGSNAREKDIVLDIALKLGKMINEKYPDVEVIYTRKTDIFIELDRRGDIANKAHANLFISIHANSVARGSRCPAGTETFVMGNKYSAANMEVAQRENSVILLEENYTQRYEGFDPKRAESYIIFQLMQNSYQNQSLDFADAVQTQFRNTAKRISRGVKQANFVVLWKTAMPSILVEVGFICHPEEGKYISSTAGKDKIATSLFQAFSSYKTKIEARSSFSTDSSAPVTDAASKRIEYGVQIATSSKPVDTDPNNFRKHTGVERIQTSANLFKYIIGRTGNYDTALEKVKKMRTDFRDAFVICIIDGKILSVAEGQKLIAE